MGSSIDFKEFTQQQDYSLWEKAALKQLKGKALTDIPNTALNLKPYYKAENTSNALKGVLLPSQACKTSFFFNVEKNEASINKAILQVLSLGLSSITLEIKVLPKFNILFNEIYLDYIDVHLIITDKKNTTTIAKALKHYLNSTNQHAFTGSFISKEGYLATESTTSILGTFNQIRLYSITSDKTSIKDQISDVLLQSNMLIKKGLKNNLTIDEISAKTILNYALTTDIVSNIAGLRALRKLWGILINSYNPLHSCSTYAYISTFNNIKPFEQQAKGYQNILHQSTRHLVALTGMADQHIIQGFDLSKLLPEHFSNRVSANIGNILQEESFLGQVQDPLAGAYYIEKATEKLIKESWTSFAKNA